MFQSLEAAMPLASLCIGVDEVREEFSYLLCGQRDAHGKLMWRCTQNQSYLPDLEPGSMDAAALKYPENG